MTVGGSTIGSATSVSNTGARRQRVVLSHWASGRPSPPSSSVVHAASSIVRPSDCQRLAGKPRNIEVVVSTLYDYAHLSFRAKRRFCGGIWSENGRLGQFNKYCS